jgi:hypothetical protein
VSLAAEHDPTALAKALAALDFLSGGRLSRWRDDQRWSQVGSGSPKLADVLAWIDCQVEAIHDAGDHEICIGWVRELAVERDAGPLLFHRGGHSRFGV